MWQVLKRNSAALLALFIFVLGNGFFATLISTILTHRKVSPFIIGLMTTCFYGGLVVGAFRIERLISRVAHIRAYAAFSSMLAVIALLHGFFDNLAVWLVLRFIGGIATAGVYIVVESWLLTQSTRQTRGQILSLYMIAFYAAQSLSQFLLGYYDQNALFMFAVISMASSLSVIPVAITRAETPHYGEPSTLSLKTIFKQCASGLTGSFIAGLVMGTIYGLFPVYFIHQFKDSSTVAILMFFVIFGGMLLQYPIGKLSDSIERRLVLLITSLVSIALVFGLGYSTSNFVLFSICCLFFGGLTFTLYPVSISYACDSLETKDIIAGTQTLLLAYSIGAMIGPVIAPIFMNKFGQWGLFSYFIFVLTLLSVFLSWRKAIKASSPQEEIFLAYPHNTPVSCEADPRAEPSIDTTIGSDNSDEKQSNEPV